MVNKVNGMVSIIVPCHNSFYFIKDCLESVLAQTYRNWEMIIIDDFSTDNSSDLIQKYINRDSRIKLIKHEKNSGVAIARNTGIKNAIGDYIAFLDSDDYWHPKKLEIQLLCFLENDVDVVFSEYYRFNNSGMIGKVSVPNEIVEYKDLLKGNCIGNLTGIYRRKKFLDIFQKSVGAEDYLFWLEIFSRPSVKGIGIPMPLAYYRVAEKANSLSGNKFRSAKWTWNIYFYHLNLGLFKSIYCFIFYIYFAFRKRI